MRPESGPAGRALSTALLLLPASAGATPTADDGACALPPPGFTVRCAFTGRSPSDHGPIEPALRALCEQLAPAWSCLPADDPSGEAGAGAYTVNSAGLWRVSIFDDDIKRCLSSCVTLDPDRVAGPKASYFSIGSIHLSRGPAGR